MEFRNHYKMLILKQSRHSSNSDLTQGAFMGMNRILLSLSKQYNTAKAKANKLKKVDRKPRKRVQL
jgi:hypothetical protein